VACGIADARLIGKRSGGNAALRIKLDHVVVFVICLIAHLLMKANAPMAFECRCTDGVTMGATPFISAHIHALSRAEARTILW